MKHEQPEYHRLLLAAIAGLSGLVLGLLALLFKLTQRHGEVLLELEEHAANASAPPAPPEQPAAPSNPMQLLFERGMPAGSVGMNFELPALSGGYYTLTQFQGRRVLLIFVSPTCEHSLYLLPALSRLPADPPPGHPYTVIVSTGDPELNRQVMELNEIHVPVLLQSSDEVASLYFVNATPEAYLLDPNGITEVGRVDGPQAILGAAFAAIGGHTAPPVDMVTPLEPSASLEIAPLRRGDQLPAIEVTLLDGQVRTSEHLCGRRHLLVLFDPACAPCLELLPDLAALHHDPAQPDILMISRRDPAMTRDLAREHDMPYPIGLQRHWEIARQLGSLAVPAACLLAADSTAEADLAVGRQALFELLGRLRQGTGGKRLVSLTSLLG